MVEWIEIKSLFFNSRIVIVSTLVVEWIEIGKCKDGGRDGKSLHPRGGVD